MQLRGRATVVGARRFGPLGITLQPPYALHCSESGLNGSILLPERAGQVLEMRQRLVPEGQNGACMDWLTVSERRGGTYRCHEYHTMEMGVLR